MITHSISLASAREQAAHSRDSIRRRRNEKEKIPVALQRIVRNYNHDMKKLRLVDIDPNATFKSQELIALSESATGTKHPSPLSLVQADSGVTAPAVSKDDQDHWAFSASMKLTSGEELPFALVVKGTTQQ